MVQVVQLDQLEIPDCLDKPETQELLVSLE